MKYFVYRGKRHYIKFVKSESNCSDDTNDNMYYYSCGDFIEHSDCREVSRNFIVIPNTTIGSFLRDKEEEIKSYYWELAEDRIGYKCIAAMVNSTDLDFYYIPVLCKVRIPKGALVYDGPFDSKKRATEAYIEKIYSVEETYELMKMEFDATDFIRPKNSYMSIRAIMRRRLFYDICEISSGDYLKCIDKVCPGAYFSMYEVTNPKITENLTVYKEGMHIDLTNEFDFEPKQCAAGFHYFDSDLHAAAFMTRVCVANM